MFLKQKTISLIILFLIPGFIEADYNSDKWNHHVASSFTIGSQNGGSGGNENHNHTILTWQPRAQNKICYQDNLPQNQHTIFHNIHCNEQQGAIVRDILSGLNYIELGKRCISRHHDPVVQQIYVAATKHFFYSDHIQAIIQQDPLWQNASEEQRASHALQSKLLTRSHYELELERCIRYNEASPSAGAKRLLYDVIDLVSNVDSLSLERMDDLIFAFIHQATMGRDNYPPEVQDMFFHPSGVLRNCISDPYVQRNFLHNRTCSLELMYEVNSALYMREKKNNFLHQAYAERVLRFAQQSLNCRDEKHKNFYERQALSAYDEIYHSSIKTISPRMNDNYRSTFNQLVINPVHEDRVTAYEKSKIDNFQEYYEEYEVTPESKGFMLANNLNLTFYRKFFEGNCLQHHMTKELLQIMHQATLQGRNSLTDNLADFVDVSNTCNHAKQLENCMTATDICWNILEYGKGVSLGCCDTVVGTAVGVYNLLASPIDSVAGIIVGVTTLAKNIGTHTFNRVFHKEKAIETERALFQMVYGLMEEYNNKSGPEKTRVITHFVTDYVCTGKALAAIGKLGITCGGMGFKALREKAIKVAKTFSKERVVQTSAGKMLMSCREGGEKAVNKVVSKAKELMSRSQRLQQKMALAMRKYLPNVVKIKQEILTITKEFGITTTNFIKKNMETIIDFDHVFLPQPATGTNLLKTRIRGFHHDFKNYIENFKGIKLINKQYKQGCMAAKACWVEGKLTTKTFFPSDWNRRKVAIKIREALKNAVKEVNPITGKTQAIGKTSEGIVIRFHFEQIGKTVKITSAFPCGKWLLGL